MSLAYIPNLNLERFEELGNHSSQQLPRDKDACLSAAFVSLSRLHVRGEKEIKVLGHSVNIAAWIYYIIRDTEGNNPWVMHYNFSGKLAIPYQDFNCSFPVMLNRDPLCIYICLEEAAAHIDTSKLAKTKKNWDEMLP